MPRPILALEVDIKGSAEVKRLGQDYESIAVALAAGCTFACAGKSLSAPYPTPVILPRLL